MEKLSKLFTIMLMAVMSISLTACGDDDDDDNGGSSSGSVTEAALLGTWEIDYRQSWEVINGVRMNFSELPEQQLKELEREKERAEFKEDHIVNVYDYIDGRWVLDDDDSGTWRLDGNRLIITTNKHHEDLEEELTIPEIDNNHFILKHVQTEIYNGQEFVQEMCTYMKRV